MGAVRSSVRAQALTALALVGLATLARAELPLPANLVGLSTGQGQAMLLDATYRSDYFLLGQHFVTQINTAFCGAASSAMVLNALNTPRPPQDAAAGFTNPNYAYYTQVNVFNDDTEKVVPQTTVRQQGMSLVELSGFLGAHEGVSSSYLMTDPSKVTLDQFRTGIISALSLPEVFVIVNFDRNVLMEYGGGHHSPIAAYHAESDSVLVLDVSRYKYVAWWVPLPQLYRSCSETLDSATKQTRGLVFVWARAQYGTALDLTRAPPATRGTDNGLPYVTPNHHLVHNSNSASRGLIAGEIVLYLILGACLTGGAAAIAWFASRGRRRRGSGAWYDGDSDAVAVANTGSAAGGHASTINGASGSVNVRTPRGSPRAWQAATAAVFGVSVQAGSKPVPMEERSLLKSKDSNSDGSDVGPDKV